jgi:hypothetical protein
MPRSNLVDAMRASAASRSAETKSDQDEPTSSSPFDVPQPPELPEMLGPEGMSSWERDQERLTMQVRYGMTLFECFNSILEAHQRERRTPEVEPATDPRERAQQIIDVLRRHGERYLPILDALTAWHQTLQGLRRFYVKNLSALAWQALRVALEEATRRLRQPVNSLSALPDMPEMPAADDERALEAALNVLRQVKATLTEYANATAEARQSLFGVRESISRVVEIVRQEDLRLSTDPSAHSLTTLPSVYPVRRVAFTVAAAEPPDTSAYGQHSWYLP